MLSRCRTGSSTTVQRRNSFYILRCGIESVKAKKHFKQATSVCAHEAAAQLTTASRTVAATAVHGGSVTSGHAVFSARTRSHSGHTESSFLFRAKCPTYEQRSRCQCKQCQPKHRTLAALENPLLRFRDQRQCIVSTCKCP